MLNFVPAVYITFRVVSVIFTETCVPLENNIGTALVFVAIFLSLYLLTRKPKGIPPGSPLTLPFIGDLPLLIGGDIFKSFGRDNWTASSEFGTYRLCEQRRFRRACASAQSRQNLRCSLIQAVSQEEPSDRKPDPWPLWMAGHAQLKFVMTECSKTQIGLTRPIWWCILFLRWMEAFYCHQWL